MKTRLRPRVVVDWDGTVTEEDTLLSALRNFVAPATLDPLMERVDAALAAGRMTLQEVMEAEFSAMNAPVNEVVAYIVEHARVRAGFAEFVARFDPLILSTSFHETIEPILAREGITASVRAGRVNANATGWEIRWVATEICSRCGERCKRSLLPSGPFVYIGDGYSDRCAALMGTRVFARDGLAQYLDTLEMPYETFTDFHEITAALASP